MCELLLGAILLVLLALLVQSERLRRALRSRPLAPIPAPVSAPPDAVGPGLSAHCGHTHHRLVTDAQGLTACPACAERQG